jgi:hypothetical protein
VLGCSSASRRITHRRQPISRRARDQTATQSQSNTRKPRTEEKLRRTISKSHGDSARLASTAARWRISAGRPPSKTPEPIGSAMSYEADVRRLSAFDSCEGGLRRKPNRGGHAVRHLASGNRKTSRRALSITGSALSITVMTSALTTTPSALTVTASALMVMASGA